MIDEIPYVPYDDDIRVRVYEETYNNYYALYCAKGVLSGTAKGYAEIDATHNVIVFGKGVAYAKFETLQRMKADNMPIDLIAKYTGLTLEQIEKL